MTLPLYDVMTLLLYDIMTLTVIIYDLHQLAFDTRHHSIGDSLERQDEALRSLYDVILLGSGIHDC